MDCLMKYLHKKKKKNEIISRGLGIHCWPAWLSVSLSLWAFNDEKFCYTEKLGHWTILFEEESNNVVFPKAWHYSYFDHIMLWVPVFAYVVLLKAFVTGYAFGLSLACSVAAWGYVRLYHKTQHGTRSHCW